MKSYFQNNTNLAVYLLAFFLGWAGYSLKLVSIVKLLDELDFSFYPLLMLIQGVTLFGSIKLMTKISENNQKRFYLITLVSGLLLTFIANNSDFNQFAVDSLGWRYSFIVFLLSAFIMLAIDITSRLLVTSKISMLENPKAATFVTFFTEFGGLFAAIMTLLLVDYLASPATQLLPIALAIPFIFALMFVFLMHGKEKASNRLHENPKIEQALKQHSASLRRHLGFFLPILIALVAAVLLIKHFQGFAVIVGLKQWQENSQQSITAIFSWLAIAQNSLILLILVPYFFVKNRSTVWSNGFRVLFSVQAASMLLISLIATPLTLLGTGVLRKVVQRSLVGKSMNMLTSSIPESIRFEVKSKSQKYAHTIAFVSLSLFSFLAINDWISYQLVWILAAVVALVGLYLIKILLKKLNRFHVENVVEFSHCPFNVYEAISSCYSLANKDAAKYFPKISNVINKKYSRSIFAKALIHTMGEMKNAQAVEYLFELFDVAKREDVQLEILKALNRFEGLEIDHFMLTVLKKTMYQDTQRGELRTSFCKVIAARLPQQSISVATQAIEENQQDSRVLGNAIDVLGEISEQRQSKKIRRYLAKFLSSQYSRRIRLNAIKHLYFQAKHRNKIEDILQSFEASEKIQDQAGAAYLYGVLSITEKVDFVSQLNILTKRRNSTVLLSLIRLGVTGAELDFIQLLREANPEQALNYLKQLYRVRESRFRYLVYSSILEFYPEDVSHVLHAMRDSYKNFDEDRRVIIEEAQRRGIAISDDLLYLVQ
jgi:hypothetical protein